MGKIEEAVARAICKASGNENPEALLDVHEPASFLWKEFIPEARAAVLAVLRAIRKPSEAMCEAVDLLDESMRTGVGGCPCPFDVAWTCMIDALIKEAEQ